MKYSFRTDNFLFEFIESQIDNNVLWESHCHPQYELIAVFEGDISIMIEGRSYTLNANNAIVIPPLSYHTVTANKRGKYKRMMALFDPPAFPEVLQKYFINDRATVFYSYQLKDFEKILASEDAEFYKPFAESIMVRIMYECIESRAPNSSEDINDVLNQIISYIDGHLCEKITLDDIALHTARSKSSVCHLFCEQMKISPKQYILQKKLALAGKLIHDGVPPTIAAMRIGYDNYSDFYRMYVKHFKKMPSQYKIHQMH